MEDQEVIEAMERYGGSFIQAFARLYRVADLQNQRKLRNAFADYWDQYAEMAKDERRQR